MYAVPLVDLSTTLTAVFYIMIVGVIFTLAITIWRSLK